jgi:hypothetical protein
MSEVIDIFKKNSKIIDDCKEEIAQDFTDIVAANKANADRLAKQRVKDNRKLVNDLKLKGK